MKGCDSKGSRGLIFILYMHNSALEIVKWSKKLIENEKAEIIK